MLEQGYHLLEDAQKHGGVLVKQQDVVQVDHNANSQLPHIRYDRGHQTSKSSGCRFEAKWKTFELVCLPLKDKLEELLVVLMNGVPRSRHL